MDGTLRKPFNGDGFDGHTHLKTGSLRDVRSVAGYVQDRAGRRMAVVCLHNNSRADIRRRAGGAGGGAQYGFMSAPET